MRRRPRKCPIERFYSKIRVEGECWVWKGARHPGGYGNFYLGPDSSGKSVYVSAYRWCYMDRVGQFPGGLELDHLCRNPPCVNPSHLEPVTHLENMRRGSTRQATHCKHGHEFTAGNTRITPEGWRKCRACHRGWEAKYKRQRLGLT